jgi:hypothetical protein
VSGALNRETITGICDTCRYIEVYTSAFDHSDEVVEHPSAAWRAVCGLAKDIEDVVSNCEVASAVFVHPGEVEDLKSVDTGSARTVFILAAE